MAAGDRALFRALYGCADTLRHVGAAMDTVRADAAFDRVIGLLDAHPGRYGYWCLPGAGGTAAGLMALLGDADGAGGEVGVLLPPAAQRSGVATAAIGALARAVFARTALQRLWTRHAPGHEAAAALMRRLGFSAIAPDAEGRCRWELRREAWTSRGDGYPSR